MEFVVLEHVPPPRATVSLTARIIAIMLLIQLTLVAAYAVRFVHHHFFRTECDLQRTYGRDTWALVTGCSSGQGKRFVMELAQRGFHIILMGRATVHKVATKVMHKFPHIKTKCIVVDFVDAFKDDFFAPVNEAIQKLEESKQELSILVNNVGHRVAWKPYHEMPPHLIKDCIACGTIVQSRMTQIALAHFMKRSPLHKSLLVNITAIGTYQNFWFGQHNHFSLPYLSVYESANAYGFFHSNSIQEEYGDMVDVLNVMPGAVITKNTSHALRDTPFSVDDKTFVMNVMKLFGNCTGPQYAHWKHELAALLPNFIPKGLLNAILSDTAIKLREEFMAKYTPAT
jgi:short-subunit dehydrogenase